MIKILLVLTFLGIGTVLDIKKKSVPKVYLFLGGMVAILYLIFIAKPDKGENIWLSLLLGMMPGIVCLILSYVSQEQIGFGDGWVIMLIGMLSGVNHVLGVLCIGLISLTVVAFFLLIIGRVKRKTTIPFIPFLLWGHIVVCICGSII